MSSDWIDINKTQKDLKPENSLDRSLRPGGWNEYIGQADIKNNLRILIEAAKNRKQSPEHILFYGPPGLGKTTLSHLIAKELEVDIKITSGPAVEKVGDLASILTNLNPGDVLFIDEIHRLNKMIEEILYPAMESGYLNIVIGKGPGARIVQLDLPPFTLVAATTRIALLSSPLRSRFSGGTFRLNFYSNEEINEIVKRSSDILNIKIENPAVEEISKRSRHTPRIANHLLKRCRDYAEINKEGIINSETILAAMNLIGLDDLGLTGSDRQLLSVLVEKFNGGPAGLNTLAAALAEEQSTLEEVYEPFLIQNGLIKRTHKGRMATPKTYEHLKINPPANLFD
ncbi:MAG: Holliday junction branch migration DNA helicase RuvB [Patescibacteria group bacterium]